MKIDSYLPERTGRKRREREKKRKTEGEKKRGKERVRKRQRERTGPDKAPKMQNYHCLN